MRRTVKAWVNRPSLSNRGARGRWTRGASSTLREKFASKVSAQSGGCWTWSGCVNPNGYGIVRHENRAIYAHRASWIVHHGSIPNGMQVCHRCDVPRCVNPAHLFLGTQSDNILDAYAKGRKVVNDYPRGPRGQFGSRDGRPAPRKRPARKGRGGRRG